MPRPAPGEKPLYSGTLDCATKTIRNEGVRGLYKGMSAPLTGVAPIFAMCFAGYALGKRLQQRGEDSKLTYPQIFVAGSFSGLFSTFIMAPGERIKVLLQTQGIGPGGEKKYTGMIDCAGKLYKEGGLRSVFKGSCATMLRGEWDFAVQLKKVLEIKNVIKAISINSIYIFYYCIGFRWIQL